MDVLTISELVPSIVGAVVGALYVSAVATLALAELLNRLFEIPRRVTWGLLLGALAVVAAERSVHSGLEVWPLVVVLSLSSIGLLVSGVSLRRRGRSRGPGWVDRYDNWMNRGNPLL